MGRQPWRRRVIVCAGREEAQKRISAIGDYVTKKPIVQKIFPWLMPLEKANWSKSSIDIIRFTPEAIRLMSDPVDPMSLEEAVERGMTIASKDPSVEARGVLGGGTGSRADEIYYDDPVDFQNSRGRPALIPLVIDAFLMNWEPVKTKAGGEGAYYGTPWAEADLLAYLKLKAIPVDDPRAETAPPDKWRHYRVPVVEISPGIYRSAWPEKFTSEKLAVIKEDIGSASFSMAYLLKVISDEDRMFTEGALAKITPITLEQFPTKNEEGIQVPDCFTVGGLDLAISKKKTADWRALATIHLLPNGQRVLADIIRGRWGSVDTVDVLIDAHKRLNYAVVKVENNSMQEAVREWIPIRVQSRILAGTLDPGFSLHTSPHTTTSANRLAEDIGLPSLAAEFEAGRWSVILPTDHTTAGLCACWFCYFLEEARGIMSNGKTLADHDDTVFATWFAREACMSGRNRGAGTVGEKRKLRDSLDRRAVRKKASRF